LNPVLSDFKALVLPTILTSLVRLLEAE
jgi:hypothetical protein